MWTPAIERDRRIALQDRSTRFFGTDFSFEDLEERDVEPVRLLDAARRGVGRRRRRAGRFSRRRSETKSSQYTRSIVWIRKDNYAFARIENYVKDQAGSAAELLRHPERPGHLDRAAARDGRSAPRQPHAADARQAAVQRAAEGRGLHAAGAPPAVRRALAVCLRSMSSCRPPAAARRPFSQRGFVERRGVSAFRRRRRTIHARRSATVSFARRCSSSRRPGCSLPPASTCAPTRTIRSNALALDFQDRRRCAGLGCRSGASRRR